MLNKLVLLSCCILIAPLADACSTCMVGDPTQSLMGAEKPFEDRLRLSLDYMSRTEELGRDGFNRKIIDENRFSLGLAYAPNTKWMLGLNLPYVNRQLESFNLANQEVSKLGDITLTVKNFLQENQFMQQHMYGFLGGIKLPTADEEKDSMGIPLDFDVQAGQGATVVNFGFWYAHFKYPYHIYSSASYHVASDGDQGFQAGDALVYNTTAQIAHNPSLSYYLGLEGRTSQKDTFDGTDDPDSGGTIVFLTPGLIYTIQQDLLLNLVYKLPVVEELDGDHEETGIFSIGLTYDFAIH